LAGASATWSSKQLLPAYSGEALESRGADSGPGAVGSDQQIGGLARAVGEDEFVAPVVQAAGPAELAVPDDPSRVQRIQQQGAQLRPVDLGSARIALRIALGGLVDEDGA
jgi:hypothetical protein